MGDVIRIGARRPDPTTPPIAQPRVSLRECTRRTEIVMDLAAILRRATAHEPRVTLALRSDSVPIEDRIWTVVARIDGGPERRIHGPVHSDDVDMLAGCVRAGAARWAEALVRRLSIRVAE